jgi:hypothetical protein
MGIDRMIEEDIVYLYPEIKQLKENKVLKISMRA